MGENYTIAHTFYLANRVRIKKKHPEPNVLNAFLITILSLAIGLPERLPVLSYNAYILLPESGNSD